MIRRRLFPARNTSVGFFELAFGEQAENLGTETLQLVLPAAVNEPLPKLI